MKHLNIEIKARCDNQDRVRSYLKSHKADFKGTDLQIDTYFNVAHGRLKLREGKIENHLIHYDRLDQEGPKQSKVTLFKSKPGSSLKEVLTKALGVLVVVEKQREIYFIENVKFHIDEVRSLGTFMEIEAIDSDGVKDKDELNKQCKFYLGEMQISEADLVSCSYSDLIIKQLSQ